MITKMVFTDLQNMSCTFEDGDMCHFTNDDDDIYDWNIGTDSNGWLRTFSINQRLLRVSSITIGL